MKKFKSKSNPKSNPKSNSESNSINDLGFIGSFINSQKFKKFKKKLEWLDPFHYVDLFVMPKVKKFTDSWVVEGVVNLFFAGLFAGLIYFFLSMLFGSSTPLVIVYSESMEPYFYRGDVMALSGINGDSVFTQEINLDINVGGVEVSSFAEPQYIDGQLNSIIFENGEQIVPNKEGDVIVYSSYPTNLPIIHRAIVKINANDGIFFLTKGDNYLTNPTYDQDCGEILLNNPKKSCVTFFAVKNESIQGKSFFKIPLVGCIKLWLVDDLFSVITTGKLPSNFNGFC
jgi:signal peptidase I